MKELLKEMMVEVLNFFFGGIMFILLMSALAIVSPFVISIKNTVTAKGSQLVQKMPFNSISFGGYSPVAEAELGINDKGNSTTNISLVTPTKNVKGTVTYSNQFGGSLSDLLQAQNQSKSVKLGVDILTFDYVANNDGSLKSLYGITVKFPVDKKKWFGLKGSLKFKSEEHEYRIKNYEQLPLAIPKYERTKTISSYTFNPIINRNSLSNIKKLPALLR